MLTHSVLIVSILMLLHQSQPLISLSYNQMVRVNGFYESWKGKTNYFLQRALFSCNISFSLLSTRSLFIWQRILFFILNACTTVPFHALQHFTLGNECVIFWKCQRSRSDLAHVMCRKVSVVTESLCLCRLCFFYLRLSVLCRWTSDVSDCFPLYLLKPVVLLDVLYIIAKAAVQQLTGQKHSWGVSSQNKLFCHLFGFFSLNSIFLTKSRSETEL